MLPRCRRGADIVARRMPSWFRRGYLSCSGGRGGLVLRKAVKAALTQLWIGDWTALSAHSRLPKAPIGFEEPIVTLALKDILSRSGAARRRVGRHRGERCQAHSENQARSSIETHDERLHTWAWLIWARGIRERLSFQ